MRPGRGVCAAAHLHSSIGCALLRDSGRGFFRSAGCYAPSITNLETVLLYEATMNNQVQEQMAVLSSTVIAMQQLFNRTGLESLANASDNLQTQAASLLNRADFGQVNKYSQVELVKTANNLFNAFVSPVVGYNPATKTNTTSQMTVSYP